DDLQSQNIFVEANGCPHVRNPKGNRRNLLNHKMCLQGNGSTRPAVVLEQRELLFPRLKFPPTITGDCPQRGAQQGKGRWVCALPEAFIRGIPLSFKKIGVRMM